MKGLDVKRIMINYNLSLTELATKINKSPQQVGRWVNNPETNVSHSVRKQFQTVYPEYFKYESQTTDIAIVREEPGAFNQAKYIDVIEVTNSKDIMNKNLKPVGKVDVSDFLDSERGIIMQGDALSGVINGGDIAGTKVWTRRDFFLWGSMYVIVSDGHVIFRIVKPSEDKDSITLISTKDTYDPITLPKSAIDEMYIINGGIVKY